VAGIEAEVVSAEVEADSAVAETEVVLICTVLFAQTAEENAKFLSDLVATSLFTAVTALRTREAEIATVVTVAEETEIEAVSAEAGIETEEVSVKRGCTRRFAPNAVRNVKFLSSLMARNLFTATTASAKMTAVSNLKRRTRANSCSNFLIPSWTGSSRLLSQQA